MGDTADRRGDDAEAGARMDCDDVSDEGGRPWVTVPQATVTFSVGNTERLRGEDAGVVRLTPDSEVGEDIVLESLTDLLASCSGVLADDVVRTGEEDLPGIARGTLTVTAQNQASQRLAPGVGSTQAWMTVPWAAESVHHRG